ncbi:hypothetical protein [Salinisphaera sp. LB1]|uniref:hypothetical protein n=1 Tax=Salinisphaera sp. LB1 TaxID=2183911 RepID=UPI000D7E398E|nr:hypothetical protein [Salinisphaera sp. LB1]AWN17785.1 hypothetical protein SALB1_3593 [Salinisphaera sp. LB1]
MSQSMASTGHLQARYIDDFEQTLERLSTAPSFSKLTHQIQLLGRAQKLLRTPAGVEALYSFAPRFDTAGVFLGGDWLDPGQLEPALAGPTLRAGGADATLESLSELRLLAIAERIATSDRLTADAARALLCEILAANLDLLFPVATEATRDTHNATLDRAQTLFDFLFARVGAGAILDALVAEVERVMAQRPIALGRVTSLLVAAERALATGDVDDAAAARATPWLRALRAPTELTTRVSRDDYPAALAELDDRALAAEAAVFGRSMTRHGLVCPAHADLAQHLCRAAPALLPVALDLDATGQAAWARHSDAIETLIQISVMQSTASAIYGLSRLLNDGMARLDTVLPGLDRLTRLALHPRVAHALTETDPRVPAMPRLVAGAIAVLGQPRGIDQGFNPTCQAARASCLWSCNDPARLLALLIEASETNDLVFDFENQPIRASETGLGMAKTLHTELDPVSLVLTPHLDRIYVEMGRRTALRPGDGHRWVNREMHGAWVAPDFAELIDLAAGGIAQFEAFIRLFHASYHPTFNGGREVEYAQPCGIAATDAAGSYIGWHAISIQRVARDPGGIWRVYFFNPNRDKGQNWGQGIETSTAGAGELAGESSLPFGQFASRLYVFHYHGHATGDPAAVPEADVDAIRELVAASWGARFTWLE